jgi:hypothetical protein
MRTVQIDYRPAATPQGYRWVWRSEDGTTESSREFDLFYDCMADARALGYDVRLGRPPACLHAGRPDQDCKTVEGSPDEA